MTDTYRPLATITLASTSTSVTFSSIPATYRDLVVVGAGFASTPAGVLARFNGDVGANYNQIVMFGDGSTPSSSASANQNQTQFGRFDNTTLANFITSVMDYSATDKHKTFLSRYNSSAVLTAASAGRYASTSAITSLRLFPESGNFSIGVTFSLYGIVS